MSLAAIPFTHLHTHSEYSLLDGMARIEPLLRRAKELGMDALAITDHGVLYGAIEFYLEAKAQGVKPIIGCEAYVAPGSRHERRPKEEGSPYHLVLLAADLNGYQNLIRLISKAHGEGFYYKPRVDKELLEAHHAGLIALGGCASGEVPRALLSGNLEAARDAAKWYRDVFGRDNFFLEVQRHDKMPELEQVNLGLIEIARDLGIGLVATNDSHYIHREDSSAHEVLLCVGTNTTIDDPKRRRMPDDSFYLKSPEEMAALFADLPEAIANTHQIAERCDLKLEFNRLNLPSFPIPDGYTTDSYLEKLCREGLRRCYEQVTPEIDQRLRYELDVIRQTGFAQYMLIVADFVQHAHSTGILCGPRGSAAGSIVSHCLGISDIDPVANKLVFERFLNIERKEMPDVDMDFADDQRDLMIEYATQKYGRDHVAQIITFGTLGAKAAIRDVGRALAMPYGEVDRVAKLVPSLPVGITIDKAMDDNPQLRQAYEEDEAVRRLIDTAKRLEGIARHSSTHAAGVVISGDPLIEHVPTQRAGRGEDSVMTQYPMNAVAKIGLLKMDFLGLANLTVLGRAVKMIKQTRGIDLDLRRILMDDPKVFDLLSAGYTTSVFQLEGAGMTRYIKELKPTTIDDLAAMIALYRPGPLAHIPRYIRCKHDLEPVEYPHPLLEPILQDTYGIIVYQDQVLHVVRAVAGYSLGQADILRKAMGKKVAEIMAKERSRFVAGARANGLSEDEATGIFDIIEPFAGYAFNRSHAYCYALVAYRTAYLKANYPVEYMVAVLSTASGNAEKVSGAIAECRRLGIVTLPPDINKAEAGFTVENIQQQQAIRFGLAAIKNVGAGPIEALLAARQQGGAFRTVDDLAERVDLRSVNKRAMESLIKAGALDSLGRRSQLLAVLDRIMGAGQQAQRAAERGQASLFDYLADDSFRPGILLPDIPEAIEREKLAWEKELLGLYVSDHPMQRAALQLRDTVTAFCGEIGEDMVGQRVTVAGVIGGLRQLVTKKRDAMVAATLEDLHGTVEVVAFPKVYTRTADCWQEDAVVIIQGKVDSRADSIQIICEAVDRYEPGLEQEAQTTPSQGQEKPAAERGRQKPAPQGRKHLTLSIQRSDDVERDIILLRDIYALLQRHKGGSDSVEIRVPANGHARVAIELPDIGLRVAGELEQRLTEMLGPAAVRLEAVE